MIVFLKKYVKYNKNNMFFFLYDLYKGNGEGSSLCLKWVLIEDSISYV